MKIYCFLSCLPAFLLSTVGNSLPAVDSDTQPEFTELNPPSVAGHFVSQVPPNGDATVQADTNPNVDSLLFSVSSENPNSQTEYSSQTSIAEDRNSGSDESLCDDEPESGHGSKNVNKHRKRRDGTMCSVKEEDIDWDLLWINFSKSQEPVCINPSYPVHVCCRGPQSRYVYNPSLLREVRNCAPCKLSLILYLPCRYSGNCWYVHDWSPYAMFSSVSQPMLPDFSGKADYSCLSRCSWSCLLVEIADQNCHSLFQQIALVMTALVQILFERFKTCTKIQGRYRQDFWKNGAYVATVMTPAEGWG